MLVLYVVFYMLSMILSFNGYYYLSGIILGISAVGLYLHEYFKTDNPLSLKGVFSLFWIGGQSISCFKLSRLQTQWGLITWICFFLAYVSFIAGYEWFSGYLGEKRSYAVRSRRQRVNSSRLYQAIAAITWVSLLCFLTEAVLLGFVPIFSSEPHAYSYFHISGVHYFTVACVLVPALSAVYLKQSIRIPLKNRIVIILMNIISVSIPILCVSRFQLIAMILLAVITVLSMAEELRLRRILLYGGIFLLSLIPVYLMLTVKRNHDVEYLNGIFAMKNPAMPIFVTQPYMYIANNYDNFNEMVKNLAGHTFGLRMLFPLWALTGLKFIFPQLVSFPLYTTKAELTTVTLFYDSYYDFGILGVMILGLLLGVVCTWLVRLVKYSANGISHVFYAQVFIYLMFSFFTTWFSNPTTWFWFVITGIVYWYAGLR